MAKNQKVRYLALILFVAGLSGCWPTGGGVAPPPAKPVISPAASLPLRAKLDLGVIEQGQSVSLACWITNQSKNSVHISTIKSGCECLTATLSKMEIAPGEKTLMKAHYDGAREPDFLGSLQIDVLLLDEKRSQLGVVEVPIEVIRRSAANANSGP